MVNIFRYIDRFFITLTNYLTFNWIFIIFAGLFLVTAVMVIISTSRSYESKLIKAIDHFNAYFMDNPQINENNLVMFNEKMKANFVPKHLRKAWQQFVLYREGKASEYMSYDNCVTKPIRNSTYTRDVKTMNLLAWIFSICAFMLNCYYCFETIDLASVLRSAALTPALILLLNYIIQIFLSLRHSAVVSDLSQNYQYFEANMDKATETLPEYVDYEVLFDRNEIKKGIPILYAYLQKRAEQEQRELELARLKNVQHEKFNFDDQGIAAALVLERAMHESENYIAERKKYMQDIEQINNDMTQEDMNYREITKEYNRQMQVSRETFANFKSQLEEVTSSIEANYLKKQQQQELDRQRNLERDFDAATERHKTMIEGFHAELDEVDKLVAQSRMKLEKAMKSEFATYSSKVYDEAKMVVEDRQKEYHNKLKQNIINLEETIVSKNEELEHLYETNQVMNEKLLEAGISLNGEEIQPKAEAPQTQEYQPLTYEEPTKEQQEVPEYQPLTYEPLQYVPAYETEDTNDWENDVWEDDSETEKESFETIEEPKQEQEGPAVNLDELKRLIAKAQEELNSTKTKDDSISTSEAKGEGEAVVATDLPPKKKAGRPRKVVEPTNEVKKGRGRPRKEQSTQPVEQKKGRGRPRKVVQEQVNATVQQKKPVGRPRKAETEIKAPVEQKKGRGRPRKVETKPVQVVENKAGRGRPRKTETTPAQPAEVKKGRGRPRKVETQPVEQKKGRGRPKKVENVDLNNIKDIKDIDEYLKKIDNAIAEESAKIQESKKELDAKSKLKGKR